MLLIKESPTNAKRLVVCSLSEYKVLTQLCGENSHQKPGKTQSESQVQISGENKIPINALPEYKDLTQVCGEESHQRQQAHRNLKANMRGADERGKVIPTKTQEQPTSKNLTIYQNLGSMRPIKASGLQILGM